jgi:hypothetical protein
MVDSEGMGQGTGKAGAKFTGVGSPGSPKKTSPELSPELSPALKALPTVLNRRSAVGLGAAAALAPLLPASAKIDSTNPANNYYFPMAKYRYLPRIFRAWIAASELAQPALAEGDWEGMQVVWERLDDSARAMPLYTNAVEGSRSGKKKKKSEAQKELISLLKVYTAAVDDLGKAVEKKDAKKTKIALGKATETLGRYRVVAQIDKENGGMLNADEFASKSGSKLTGTGYVIQTFRGGSASAAGLSEEAIYSLKPPKAAEALKVKEGCSGAACMYD